MRLAAFLFMLVSCVTLPKELTRLESVVKAYKGGKRVVYELDPGVVVTSAQLETFLTRDAGPDREGVVTYKYPGVVVYHLVAAGRFVIVSDRASPGS